jgi:hypothetical protein
VHALRFTPALVLASLAAALLASVAPPALADADPASDVLLTDDVYFSYDASVSADLKTGLASAVTKVNHRGYRLKVALIEKRFDLGGIASLYGHPKAYAQFLGLELTGIYRGRLLIVMPKGFGFYYGRKANAKTDAMLKKIKIGPGGDGLLKAATAAVNKLASAKPR